MSSVMAAEACPSILHGLDDGPGTDGGAGCGVPQIVRRGARHPGLSDRFRGPSRRGVGPLQVAAVITGTQQCVSALSLALAGQIGQQELGKWHGALLWALGVPT